MATPELLDTTGDRRCDNVVQGLVGTFELVFPGRLRACYLRGSRASGASIEGSDLDLYVVFKDRFVDGVEGKRAQQLVDHCGRLTPMLLEVVLIGERRLRDPDALYAAVDLKLGTRLLYGEDIRPRLPAIDADAYVREIVHTPYYSYRLPRQRKDRLVYPLRHVHGRASNTYGGNRTPRFVR